MKHPSFLVNSFATRPWLLFCSRTIHGSALVFRCQPITSRLSSSDPPHPRDDSGENEEKGHLTFTKASLYKLTLPLPFPEKQHGPVKSTEASEKGPSNPASSHLVVFLLHSGQPLSYIAELIRAEQPRKDPNDDEQSTRGVYPPVRFLTDLDTGTRWSPSTGIGDFISHAARNGHFFINLGSRTIETNVPSFEDRTQYMRSSLNAKMFEIERLTRVKEQCERVAKQATHRVALAGAGVLGFWWVSVTYLTFHTELGWDTMEPITYLTGLGTMISGYIWFIWHNREVSYRTVMNETISRRQAKLYIEKGFDPERYEELIEDVKGLRKAIKAIAAEYDLEWDQGSTYASSKTKRALEIVRKEEDKQSKEERDKDDK